MTRAETTVTLLLDLEPVKTALQRAAEALDAFGRIPFADACKGLGLFVAAYTRSATPRALRLERRARRRDLRRRYRPTRKAATA